MKKKKKYEQLTAYELDVADSDESLLKSSVETVNKKFTVKTEDYEIEEDWYDTSSPNSF